MFLMMAGRGHKCENGFVYGPPDMEGDGTIRPKLARCHITEPSYAVSSCVSTVGSGFQSEVPPCGMAGIVLLGN